MAQMNLTKDWGFDFNANTYFGMEYGLKNIRWDFRLAKSFPILDLSYEKVNGVRVDGLGLFFKKNATKKDIEFLNGKHISDAVLRWGCADVEVVDKATGEVIIDEKTGKPLTERRWADKPTVVAVVIDGKEYSLSGHVRGFNEAAVIEDDAPETSDDAPADEQ
jgi:hypothetical protein